MKKKKWLNNKNFKQKYRICLSNNRHGDKTISFATC